MTASDHTSCNIVFHGLDAVRLALADGSTAVISLFGAQVLSWIPVGSGERLYLSPRAELASGKAIRGGIPVIFPQFSERGPLPRHGFARTATWALEEVQELPEAQYDGIARATFSLAANDATRAVWPCEFHARLTVTLSKGRLDVALEVENQDSKALSFTAALHTYLRVGEVEQISLTGLQGAQRLLPDSTQPDIETATELVVRGEVDNIYLDAPRPLLLTDGHHALGIAAQGFPDVVVWNPGKEKCAELADMPTDGFQHMLCVEAAAVGQAVQLAVGASWQGRQTLTTLDTV